MQEIRKRKWANLFYLLCVVVMYFLSTFMFFFRVDPQPHMDLFLCSSFQFFSFVWLCKEIFPSISRALREKGLRRFRDKRGQLVFHEEHCSWFVIGSLQVRRQGRPVNMQVLQPLVNQSRFWCGLSCADVMLSRCDMRTCRSQAHRVAGCKSNSTDYGAYTWKERML